MDGSSETNGGQDDQSVGELVQQASQQLTELVREEIHLAQLELRDKARHAGKGAGLFTGAGLLAFYGGATLITAAVLLLGLALEPWLAALVVALVLLAAAGILGLVGKRQVDEALPPTPEQTGESVREDVRYLKERTNR
jgi:Flp pilus assembly protein TadB